jgi:hypothetical protein
MPSELGPRQPKNAEQIKQATDNDGCNDANYRECAALTVWGLLVIWHSIQSSRSTAATTTAGRNLVW